MSAEHIRVSFVDSISEIDRFSWNELAKDASPFLRYEFLLALESTGCTTRDTGWQPFHVVARDKRDKLVGVMPLYQKSNSYGEYVFDWSWADAYRSNGLNYYPKFLTAIPFTPSAGPRLLVKQNEERQEILNRVVASVIREAELLDISSWHVLFPSEVESDYFAAQGLAPREGCQFHWFNRNYGSFDDFLGALSSRKRKNIRKERRSVREQGIKFTLVEGADITDKLWNHFNVFYQSTYLVRGMQGYLNEDFFKQVSKTMPENLFLILAVLDGQIVAGALFFQGGGKLFGRYWGSLEEYQFLHFETCYYQGIDYCIRNGLKQFDAGAQGEHKIQRGFEPIKTRSNHWIAHPSFAKAIEEFLEQEKHHVNLYRQESTKLLPFRKD